MSKKPHEAEVTQDPVQDDVANSAADVDAEQFEVIVEEAEPTPDNTDELNNLRQQLLRTHADFDNFRKRTRQEKEDLQQFATKKLLAELLPVADNFERAMQSFVNEEAAEHVKSGLDMVQRQLVQILQQNGVEAMDAEGQPFDPNFHDAVMQEPAEDCEVGIVVATLQKGYLLHGKVLRPAMVKVTV